MSWQSGSRTLRDASVGAASVALNAVTPGAGDILNYAYYRGQQPGTATRLNNRSRRAGLRAGASTYQGRLKKAKRVKRDPFVKNGMKHTVEITGVVTDPDCVYIGHSTYTPQFVLETTLQALLRKLFEKGGLQVTSVNDVLLPSATATDGYFLRLDTAPAGGGSFTSYSHAVASGATLQSITGSVTTGVAPEWTDLIDQFTLWATGDGPVSNDNMDEPAQLRLFTEVFNTTGSRYNMVCSLNLRELFAVGKFVSEIKIQNRTVSASGSDDAEAVSSNPLHVHKYLFNGCPRNRDKLRMISPPLYSSGILTTGASNAGFTYLKEPFSPKMFWNCSKHVKDSLQPGAIRNDKIVYYKKMRLLNFIRHMGLMSDASGTPKTNLIKGPHMMYALEDMINVNLAQLISIAYEVNRSCGVYIFQKKSKFASGGVYFETQDNEYIPP